MTTLLEKETFTGLVDRGGSVYAKGTLPSEVLVAPRRHRDYRRLVEGLELLKEQGIAEAD